MSAAVAHMYNSSCSPLCINFSINNMFPVIGCAAPVEPWAVRFRRHGDRGVGVSEQQSRQMCLLPRRGSPGPNEQPPLFTFLPQERSPQMSVRWGRDSQATTGSARAVSLKWHCNKTWIYLRLEKRQRDNGEPTRFSRTKLNQLLLQLFFKYLNHFANIKHIGMLLDPKGPNIYLLASNVYFILKVDLPALFPLMRICIFQHFFCHVFICIFKGFQTVCL